MIRAVVFDVGECLVNETREYGTWADWLGVPRHTFAVQFGAVIAQGKDYRETFQVFRPGFDLTEQRQARADAGQPEHFDESDLYPDGRDSLKALRAEGLWLGIAGNQTVRAGGILRDLFARDVDLIGTSDDWGGVEAGPGVLPPCRRRRPGRAQRDPVRRRPRRQRPAPRCRSGHAYGKRAAGVGPSATAPWWPTSRSASATFTIIATPPWCRILNVRVIVSPSRAQPGNSADLTAISSSASGNLPIVSSTRSPVPEPPRGPGRPRPVSSGHGRRDPEGEVARPHRRP